MTGKAINSRGPRPVREVPRVEVVDQVHAIKHALAFVLPRVGFDIRFDNKLQLLAQELYRIGVRAK